MRQIALSTVALLLASGLFSSTLAAPSSQALKRTPQDDAAVNQNELVVIPIEETDPATIPVPAVVAGDISSTAKRSARPQTDSAAAGAGLDTLIVIPIDDPEIPSPPVPVGTTESSVASGFAKRTRKVRKTW